VATLWSILSSVVIDESTVFAAFVVFDFLDGSKGFYDSCKHFLFYFTKFALQISNKYTELMMKQKWLEFHGEI
jgi:hypothetical protein